VICTTNSMTGTSISTLMMLTPCTSPPEGEIVLECRCDQPIPEICGPLAATLQAQAIERCNQQIGEDEAWGSQDLQWNKR
jgi:hypothetical protein